MRKQSTIAMLLLAAISCMMVANPGMPDSKKKKKKEKTETVDSVGDSVFVDSLGNEIKPKLKQADDTMQMDSLQKAIWKHNKVVDDSIRLDSIARKKQGGVDAPVNYQADDSLVYDAKNKVAYLYGNSNVKYTNMDQSRFDFIPVRNPSCCSVYTLLIRAFLLLKLNLMVSVS